MPPGEFELEPSPLEHPRSTPEVPSALELSWIFVIYKGHISQWRKKFSFKIQKVTRWSFNPRPSEECHPITTRPLAYHTRYYPHTNINARIYMIMFLFCSFPLLLFFIFHGGEGWPFFFKQAWGYWIMWEWADVTEMMVVPLGFWP